MVEGAARSLPSAIFCLLDVEVGKSVHYGVSHQLYEAFVRFTQDQGWEKFFKHWTAGERYAPVFYDIGQLIEDGMVRLFDSILEYSIYEVRSPLVVTVSRFPQLVKKDLDQEVIATIRKHHAHLLEQNAPVVGEWTNPEV